MPSQSSVSSSTFATMSETPYGLSASGYEPTRWKP
jgi:hypothetical protein